MHRRTLRSGRDNWKKVPDRENRYVAAAFRHLVAHRLGERLDPETGEPHLAHAICCLTFILEEALTPGGFVPTDPA